VAVLKKGNVNELRTISIFALSSPCPIIGSSTLYFLVMRCKVVSRN